MTFSGVKIPAAYEAHAAAGDFKSWNVGKWVIEKSPQLMRGPLGSLDPQRRQQSRGSHVAYRLALV